MLWCAVSSYRRHLQRGANGGNDRFIPSAEANEEQCVGLVAGDRRVVCLLWVTDGRVATFDRFDQGLAASLLPESQLLPSGTVGVLWLLRSCSVAEMPLVHNVPVVKVGAAACC